MKIQFLFFILIISFFIFISPAKAKIFYVNQQAEEGLNNGDNWENAFTSLKIALFEAQYGDTIWVAKGTYTPDSSLQSDAFHIKNGLAVFGGFNGIETNLSQRNILLNETILSGERGDTTQLEDNHFNVVSMTNVDSMTILDGFTITKGYADDGVNHLEEKRFLGGGLYIETTRDSFNSNPKILNCRFIKNTARRGGAIYCNGKEKGYRLVNPFIENCLFQRNYARWAGGAISKNAGGNNFEIRNSTFLENVVRFNFGGAIHFRNSFGVNNIVNCHFEKDSALISQGGAIFYEAEKRGSKLYLEDTKFSKNFTLRGGGAIVVFFTDPRFFKPAPKHEIFINNCTFDQNYTLGVGGAVSLIPLGSKFLVSINNTTFSNNYAKFSGASIHSEILIDTVLIEINKCKFINNEVRPVADGNIYLRTTGSNASSYHHLTLKNSLLANNSTGAYSAYTGQFDGKVSCEIINCTFYKNGISPINKNWSPNFDGITRYNNMKIINSIFYEEPNIINLENPVMEEIFFNNNLDSLHLADYQFENCWINALPQTNCDTSCGKNLIFNQYPLFTNPDNGDFSLIPCSPAINAGNNTFLLASDATTDVIGNTRIKDNIIDMGAYENDIYQPITLEFEKNNASSANSADGAIIIKNIIGNKPPYHYNWNNGDTSTAIQNLSPDKYHLTITDSDGCSEEFEFEVSFTSSIHFNENEFSSTIYPNPIFDNTAYIKIRSAKKEQLIIHIHDILGRLVKFQQLQITKGENHYPLEIPNLKGVFFLSIHHSSSGLVSYHQIEIM